MAKQPRVWSGSQWEPLAVTLPDLSNYSTTTQMNTAIDNAKGLVQVVPTSITKGASGSASVSAGGAVTFSGTEFIAIDGVFTSTYQNYKVLFLGITSTGIEIYSQMRASGTTNTSVNYGWSRVTYTSSVTGNSIGADNAWGVGAANPSRSHPITLEFFGPQDSSYTSYLAQNSYYNGSTLVGTNSGGNMTVNTSYDGFRFYLGSGTLTGTIRVYGYKNG